MIRSAFTLIELLVVMAIIGILASISLSGASAVRNAAKRHQTEAVLAKVDAALRQFRADIGFYPKSHADLPGIEYESAGFHRDLAKLDPLTGLPIPDNDAAWTSDAPWRVGNGLMQSLGTRMSIAERERAIANAEAMRKIEDERFYHIGNFVDFDCTGLAKPGGFTRGHWPVAGPALSPPYFDWACVDPTGTGPVTLGEHELKRIFDHFRWSPTKLNRSNNPWTAHVPGDEHSVGTSRIWTKCSEFMTKLFQNYLGYARPRDQADAYQRALRDGVPAGRYTFDSQYDDTLTATSTWVVHNRSIDIAITSKPWRDDYLVDLEPRYTKDADGDGAIDVIDAYGVPLVYVCEGTPPAERIFPRTASVDGNPNLSGIYWGQSPNGYGTLLLFHPDPDLESTKFINASTIYSFVTDKPNSRGVQVRPDAYDIAFLSNNNGSSWIFAEHGYDIEACGDPYLLAGTLIPSRTGVSRAPAGSRAGDPYYCLSLDGEALVEPFIDANGNGQYDAGENFIDRNRNGSHDDDIAPYDIRLCAPRGEEREFELISAGRDLRFHAVRPHRHNGDNIKPGLRR